MENSLPCTSSLRLPTAPSCRGNLNPKSGQTQQQGGSSTSHAPSMGISSPGSFTPTAASATQIVPHLIYRKITAQWAAAVISFTIAWAKQDKKSEVERGVTLFKLMGCNISKCCRSAPRATALFFRRQLLKNSRELQKQSFSAMPAVMQRLKPPTSY